jgi:hypothetical protein
MSKQIVFNQEKNALFFQNNDIQYKIDLTRYKESQVERSSHFEVVDGLEKNLIYIFNNIDRMEKKLKPINLALNTIAIEHRNTVNSCKITFEVNEYQLIADEYGGINFTIDLEKITFEDVVTTPLQDPEFSHIINLDINEINSVGQSLFLKTQERYKNFDIIIKLANVSFHRPNQNTIESL